MAKHQLTSRTSPDPLDPGVAIRLRVRDQLHAKRAEFIDTALMPRPQHDKDSHRDATQESDPSA